MVLPIELGKSLSKLMIPIPCLRSLADKHLLHKRDDLKSRHPKRGKKYYIKIKVITFIINFGGKTPLKIHRCISKKGAAVSEVVVFFNCISIDHSFEIRIVTIK